MRASATLAATALVGACALPSHFVTRDASPVAVDAHADDVADVAPDDASDAASDTAPVPLCDPNPCGGFGQPCCDAGSPCVPGATCIDPPGYCVCAADSGCTRLRDMTFEAGALTGIVAAQTHDDGGGMTVVGPDAGTPGICGAHYLTLTSAPIALHQSIGDSSPTLFVSFRLRYGAAPSVEVPLLTFTVGETGPVVASIAFSPAGQLKVTGAALATSMSSAPLAQAAIYRVHFQITSAPAGSASLSIAVAQDTQPFGDPFAVADAGTWPQFTRLTIGPVPTGVTAQIDLDDIRLDTNEFGDQF